MLNEWQKQIQQRMIPFSDNFNIIEQLNDEATVKLPFKYTNIFLIFHSYRSVNGIYMVYPMMIYQFKMELLQHQIIVILF